MISEQRLQGYSPANLACQVKERRERRKDEIVAAHNQRVEKLHADIKQCVDKHNEQVYVIGLNFIQVYFQWTQSP
jgi:hypothetical protein